MNVNGMFDVQSIRSEKGDGISLETFGEKMIMGKETAQKLISQLQYALDELERNKLPEEIKVLVTATVVYETTLRSEDYSADTVTKIMKIKERHLEEHPEILQIEIDSHTISAEVSIKEISEKDQPQKTENKLEEHQGAEEIKLLVNANVVYEMTVARKDYPDKTIDQIVRIQKELIETDRAKLVNDMSDVDFSIEACVRESPAVKLSDKESPHEFVSFIDQVINGKVAPEEIDEFISQWHRAEYNSPLALMPLHQYLGMTWEEYCLYVNNTKVLPVIIAAKIWGKKRREMSE